MINLERVIKVIRIKILNKPGTFGKVADTIGSNGSNMGDITVIKRGLRYITRDITVHSKSPAQFENLVKELEILEDIKIIKTFDEVFGAHEGGLIEVKSKVEIKTRADYEKYYIPGIAKIAKIIEEKKEKIYEYTNYGNTVAVITNGTAVLNFNQDIKAETSYSVMEAICSVLNEVGKVSAIPLVIESKDKDTVVETVKKIYKSFGMVALEDISSPESLYIEKNLKGLGIPIIDINKYGNAIVTLAALINISREVGISLYKSRVGFIGFGSKSSGIKELLEAYGIEEMIAYDIKEEAIGRIKAANVEVAENLNDLMERSDIVIGTSRNGGLIKFGMVRKDQVILSLSKPEPEIKPDIALKAGAKYAGDGRLITPMLALPGLIRGTLEARTEDVSVGMMLGAAEKLSEICKEGEILPSIFEEGLHDKIAAIVKRIAVEEGKANLAEQEKEEENLEEPETVFKTIREVNQWMK